MQVELQLATVLQVNVLVQQRPANLAQASVVLLLPPQHP